MDVQFAVAKISKYASSESGDTLEMVERPHGGISFVLALPKALDASRPSAAAPHDPIKVRRPM